MSSDRARRQGRSDLPTFVRYAAIGGVGTAAHFAILAILVSAGWSTPTMATTAGAVAGALINFYLNATLNFRTNANLVGAAKFLLVAALGILVNAGLIFVLTERMGMNYLAAQVLSTLTLLGLTFAINSLWTFGRRDT